MTFVLLSSRLRHQGSVVSGYGYFSCTSPLPTTELAGKCPDSLAAALAVAALQFRTHTHTPSQLESVLLLNLLPSLEEKCMSHFKGRRVKCFLEQVNFSFV